MKTSTIVTSLLYLTTFTSALSIPDASTYDSALSNQLEKRRGGGRGGSGSSGGSRSGSSSSSGRSISSYSFSPQSNLGGRTRDGSGTSASYGGKYFGGASVPYTAGARRGGITPFLLPIGAFAFFPALWLFPVYAYPYYGYSGYRWLDDEGRNRTANVTCLCQQYSVCGCEDPEADDFNTTALAQQLTDGRGSGAPANTTLVRMIDYGNDNTTIYINGTLDNGTTASGGTEPSDESQISAAARLMLNYSGYWLMIGVVGLLVNVV